jgi:hypothetical protein
LRLAILKFQRSRQLAEYAAQDNSIPTSGSSFISPNRDSATDERNQREMPVAKGDFPQSSIGAKGWPDWPQREFPSHISLAIAGLLARRSNMAVCKTDPNQRAGGKHLHRPRSDVANMSLGPSAATPPEEQNHPQNRSKNKAEKPATTDRLHVFAPHVSKIVRFPGKFLKK